MNLHSVTTACAVCLIPLFCWPALAEPKADPKIETDPNRTYNTVERPPISVVEAEWKIRRLQTTLHNEPHNEKARMVLVQTFESLALYHEQRRNALDSWRYYKAAAEVLAQSESADKFKKRIEADRARGEVNHKLRSQYLRERKRSGFVYTSFQWLNFPKLDRSDALAFTSIVTNLVRNSWSDAQTNSHITNGAQFNKILVVSFNLHRNGKLTDLKVDQSSGSPLIDAAAMQSIRDVGEMPKLLPAMGEVVHFQSQFTK